MKVMRQHKGIKNAITGPALYEKLGFPPDKRGQRQTWNIMTHMIFVHNKPIVTLKKIKHSGNKGGYFIAINKAEREIFENSFITSALTTIARVGKIKKQDTLHASVQVALSQYESDKNKKVDGIGQVIGHLLSIIKADPGQYADDILLIKQAAGEIFIDADALTDITELSQRLTEQLKTVGQGKGVPMALTHTQL